MKSIELEVQVFEDGILGAKTRTDLPSGRYRAVIVVGEYTSVPSASHTDDHLPLAEYLDKARREHIARALARCGGNRSHAARELGVDPRTVFRFVAEQED